MLACDVGKHILIMGVFGEGIDSLFKVEEMPENDIVVGRTGLYEG